MSPHAVPCFRIGQRVEVHVAINSGANWISGIVINCWPDEDKVSIRADDGRVFYGCFVGSVRAIITEGETA